METDSEIIVHEMGPEPLCVDDEQRSQDMRHSIFADKLTELEAEKELLANGKHQEYLGEVERLNRVYCETLADNRFRAAMQRERDEAELVRKKAAIEREFDALRSEAIRQAESSIDEQKRWIELEHMQLDINADAIEVKPPPTRRHLRRRQAGDDPPSDRRSFGTATSSMNNARDSYGGTVDTQTNVHMQLMSTSTRIGNLLIGTTSANCSMQPGTGVGETNGTGAVGQGGAALLRLISGAPEQQIDEDLLAIGIDPATISRRPPSHSSSSVRPPSTSVTANGLSNGSYAPRLVIDAGDTGADIDNGKLTYNDREYLRGQHVHIETTDMGRCHAVIQSINADEILLKSVGDGKRCTVSLNDLRSGRCVWRKKPS